MTPKQAQRIRDVRGCGKEGRRAANGEYVETPHTFTAIQLAQRCDACLALVVAAAEVQVSITADLGTRRLCVAITGPRATVMRIDGVGGIVAAGAVTRREVLAQEPTDEADALLDIELDDDVEWLVAAALPTEPTDALDEAERRALHAEYERDMRQSERDGEAKLNATMLARQCDLAREAEARAAEVTRAANARVEQAEARVQEIILNTETILPAALLDRKRASDAEAATKATEEGLDHLLALIGEPDYGQACERVGVLVQAEASAAAFREAIERIESECTNAGCDCGAVDIGVGVMHEPGCGSPNPTCTAIERHRAAISRDIATVAHAALETDAGRALLDRLRAAEAAIAFIRDGWSPFGARACPACVYEAGVFVRPCKVHEYADALRAEVARLRAWLERVARLDAKAHEILAGHERDARDALAGKEAP
jgi:hypothetical protein